MPELDPPPSHWGPLLVWGNLVVALVYVLAGRTGLLLHAVGGFASLLWLPSGIAFVLVLAYGPRVAPGVWVGALATNLLTHAPPAAALLIACGNTGEALATVGLLALLGYTHRRKRHLHLRVADVGALAAAAPLAAALSAGVGVLALRLTGALSPASTAPTAATWWLGDMASLVLSAPLLLFWVFSRRPFMVWTPARVAEAGACALFLLSAAFLSIPGYVVRVPTAGAAALLDLPVGWAALRFGARGTTLALATVLACAVVGAYGPVTPPANLTLDLAAIQVYFVVTGLAALAACAVVEEARDDARVAWASAGARLEVERAAAERLGLDLARLDREVEGLRAATAPTAPMAPLPAEPDPPVPPTLGGPDA